MGEVSPANLTFHDGAVERALQGDARAAGELLLIAIRMMVVLTVFADPSIETATITLNGRNLVNLGGEFQRERRAGGLGVYPGRGREVCGRKCL